MAARRGRTASAALALALACAASFAGSAAGDEEDSPAGTRADPFEAAYFQMPAAGGYTVGVAGVQAGYEHDDLILVLAWKSDSLAYYIAPAVVGENGFHGSLGRFGRVSVRFRERGVKRITSRCHSRSRFAEAGTFVGSFAFHPIGGGGAVPARKVGLEARYRTPFECQDSSRVPGGPGVLLKGFGREGDVDVSQPGPGAPVRIAVEVGGEYGRVGVERLQVFTAPASSFSWAENLGMATLTPPRPFSGTGTYIRYRDGRTRWRGDLTVDLAGSRGLDLTDRESPGMLVHGRCRESGTLPGSPPIGGCLW